MTCEQKGCVGCKHRHCRAIDGNVLIFKRYCEYCQRNYADKFEKE